MNGHIGKLWDKSFDVRGSGSKLSIGVPSHAEGEALGKCIDSVVDRLEETEFGAESSKVFISLSGVEKSDSVTSETIRVANSMKEKYGDLINIDYSERGKVNAVNQIFQRSANFGDYLIMIDSDVTFKEGSFREVLDSVVSGEHILARGKSFFYGKTPLTKRVEEELKRKNILDIDSENMMHTSVSGPLYATDTKNLYRAFDRLGFVENGYACIPTNIICEDQFISEVMGRTFGKDKMVKKCDAVYYHPAFNVEKGDLLSYWVRGIKGGIQLNLLGFHNPIYSGPDMENFIPNSVVEIYDEGKDLITKTDVSSFGERTQRINLGAVSLEDKLQFQRNLQHRAQVSLGQDLRPGYWKPLNKN